MNKASTPSGRRSDRAGSAGAAKAGTLAGAGAGAGADPTRDLAFDLLLGVLERRRTLELGPEGAEEARDRAAAHRLAASVLRHLGTLDALLDPLLTRAPPERVRVVLRIGAAQLLLLDTPAHAAVTTAVALARRRGLAPFTGLVNAVLRRLAADGAARLAELDTVRLDIPAWLWRSWSAEAPERVRAIAQGQLREAPLDLTPRSLGAGTVLPDGAPEGAEVLPTGSIRLPPGTRPDALPGFETGAFWVQDAAAAIAARLLDARAGEYVADLCAAPGGKTAQLAATGAEVVAIERDPRRMERLRANLDRLGFGAVTTIGADAAEWRPERPLDAVLLDAPCSATGTIRRHPDALRIKRESDLAALTEMQDRLLDAARDMLRPGGRLVYAVCSLQPQEGEPRIARALASGCWTRTPVDAPMLAALGLGGLDAAVTAHGTLRTDPGLWAERGGMDGFFIAVLTRK